MEYTREARISVFIDTNKRTIDRDFMSVDDLVEFLGECGEDVPLPYGLQPGPDRGTDRAPARGGEVLASEVEALREEIAVARAQAEASPGGPNPWPRIAALESLLQKIEADARGTARAD
jgi:hypothetical protein